MKQTTNYQLPQWEMTDRVLMSDFNDMTQKIDTALASLPKTITGSFTGTGKVETTHYSIGARPWMLVLWTDNTQRNEYVDRFFLAFDGVALNYNTNNRITVNTELVTFDDDGFSITHTSDRYTYNTEGKIQTYIAFCKG